ncbi:30S ribosome-binding factor RbfA [Tepidibacillus infernus]|uniref:Ribosome-binding factor A n=1 Tax=Tepidibacillus decaturensis TaxID=1413211 RepID=A0A135L357_9BACI|nr:MULTISPECIES: 30S ribosome-binding factor RbfA [Tepidibacillus]KXG43426.1 ribosome-binding factor A [Tepidibacillus decaturensis]GBF11283.1 ribosome-binding factor A [Tepidibacillus sp. HK-1]
MANVRIGRVGEQIKKEISQLIQYDLKDPRIGFVTITGVEVTGDFSQATIYLSIMGQEDEVKESIKALEKAKGFLRSELGKRIRLRHTPELIFKVDQSIAYGSKIEKLLQDIKEER